MDALDIKRLIPDKIKDPVEWTLAFHDLAVRYKVPHRVIRGYITHKNLSIQTFVWVESDHSKFLPPCPKDSRIGIAIPRIQEHLYDPDEDLRMEKKIIRSGLKFLINRTHQY